MNLLSADVLSQRQRSWLSSCVNFLGWIRGASGISIFVFICLVCKFRILLLLIDSPSQSFVALSSVLLLVLADWALTFVKAQPRIETGHHLVLINICVYIVVSVCLSKALVTSSTYWHYWVPAMLMVLTPCLRVRHWLAVVIWSFWGLFVLILLPTEAC